MIVIFIVCCSSIGIAIGAYSAMNDISFNFKFIDIIVGYVFLLISLFLAINFHEFGHYLMGKSLNYRLLIYRIGFLSFSYENGRMKFEIINNKGYGGLCAMLPPRETNPSDRKHLLYFSGGVLANFMTGMLTLGINVFVETSRYESFFLIVFSICSILLGVINLIPFKTSGNQLTDGKIIWGILKKDASVSAMLTAFKLSVQLGSGTRPRELRMADIDPYIDDEPAILIYKCFSLLDAGEIDQLGLLSKLIISRLSDMSTVILPAVYGELVMIGCMTNDHQLIETYYPLVEKSLAKDKDVNGQRINAYYQVNQGNVEQAQEHISNGKAVAGKFPIAGQAIMELDLLDKLAQIIKGK